uniref:phosphopyruvate hydratase n=1 Tax=Hucho hucho TaxID=62062 RepID=A0A4W5NEH7_9TELE
HLCKDVEQWERLSSVVGASCSLLSDISSKPQCHSSREDAPSLPGVRGYILNQSNETTVTDLIHVTTENKGAVIIGTTCGEPCSDDSLSDVVVGLGVGYVKLGGLSRGERLTKYNRLISIEEELAQQGILGMAFSSLVFSAGRKRRLDKAMGRRGSNGLAGENTSLPACERKLCVRNHEGGGKGAGKKISTLVLLIGHLITPPPPSQKGTGTLDNCRKASSSLYKIKN